MRTGSVAALFLAPAVALVALGCSNAKGRFEEFEDRRVTLAGDAGGAPDGVGGAEPGCMPPAPGLVHGPALLALETSTLPGTAILFFGEVETPELDGATAVKYSYKALDATDRRTQVGDPLEVGPYAIGDDGHFDAPTANSTLPGIANAISLGIDITSQITLHGTICGISDFYCGTTTGTVTAPFAGATTGHFGLMLVPSIDDIPARPRFGCGEEDLAPEL